MRLINSIYSLVQNDTIIARVSSYLSHREINNVRLTERPHYFSSKKAIAFLEALSIEIPIDEKVSVKEVVGYDNQLKAEVERCCEETYKINLYSKVRKTIRIAKKKKVIVPYEQCRRGKYVLIHFPLFNGTMKLKACKKYQDIYWWCGTYRDLKVYACGNKKNRIDDADIIDKPLWDPSGGRASQEFFDKISNYVFADSEEYTDINEKDFFEKLSCNLHSGTMRGCKANPYQGWYVMLLRCDYVYRENGCTIVFGSPVFVTYETLPGYGWYYIYRDKNKEYYLEKYGNNSGHCLKSEEFLGRFSFEEFNIGKKAYRGFDFGYRVYDGHGGRRLDIVRNISLVSKGEFKQFCDKLNEEDFKSKIEGLKAVCLTTKKLTETLNRLNK